MLIRYSGLAAVLGGLLCIATAIVLALKPVGCVADDCNLPGRSMRRSGTLDELLGAAVLVLIPIALAGLVMRARDAGRFDTLGVVGVVCAGLGIAVLAAGLVVQATLFGGDFRYMPAVVVPGALALVIGLLLVGVAVLRARVLPRWAGALLIVGTFVLLGFNDQDARALLAIPFGIAWIGVGYVVWSTPRVRTMC